METLTIHYRPSKIKRYVSILTGVYFLILSLIVALYYALYLNKIDSVFYLAFIGVLFSLVLIYLFFSQNSKPLLIINKELISVDFPDQKMSGKIEWLDISKIHIGIAHLKIQTIADKMYEIDLSNLKYKDIRDVKSQLIEICELKNIPYENS